MTPGGANGSNGSNGELIMTKIATSPLSQPMRAALVDRYRVPTATANALVRRGLVVKTEPRRMGGSGITLTPEGEAERDSILAPLITGTRVRNLNTQMVGTVVTVDRGMHCDVVILRWDGWQSDTSGSPAFLVEETEPKFDESSPSDLTDKTTRAPVARDHVHDENCGSFAYAVGYLTSGIDMFLAGGNDAQQLRRDRARRI
jgi:hypothetical protein